MRSWAAFGVVGVLVLAVAACATKAEREIARMTEAASAMEAEAKACWARLETAGQFQALKAKLPPMDGTSPSMALQADQARPTAAEAAQLVEMHKGYIVPCRKVTLDGLARVNTAYAALYTRNAVEIDAEYLKLVKREQSWGDYAVASARRKAAYLQAIREVTVEVDRDLSVSPGGDGRQRQAAAAALAQMQYQQQVIAAMTLPGTAPD
jgi:hypothetical protein